MKPVLMIHNISETMYSLPLEDYVLTFDDGTADHYEHWKQLQAIPTEKIFFIITEKIGTDGYLTLEQVKELMSDPLVKIGGHSHEHTPFTYFDKLTEKVAHISNDTRIMIEWFKDYLGVVPTVFCFPYNDNLDGIYRGMLKQYGFKEFYGKERIPVEHLLNGHSLS
jgi:peptidoglycan/xylan/chitin deacetylase (PgdA/CDA1 family)